jgi:hypothetical protein
LVAALLLFACLGALAFASPTAEAKAQSDGLRISSTTTYTVDRERQTVWVNTDIELVNTRPIETNPDGSTTGWVYSSFSVPIAPDANGLSVLVGGANVDRTLTTQGSYKYVEIELPFGIKNGETRNVSLSYSIPDGGPRAGRTNAQVSDSFLSLGVWTFGTPGRANVRVIVPNVYDVELVGSISQFKRSQSDGNIILEAYGIASPRDFNGRVLGEGNVTPDVKTLTLDSGRATIVSEPGDVEWTEFVEDTLVNYLPALEEFIGVPFPQSHITIEESTDPLVDGWGGTFSGDRFGAGTIQIDEDIDRETLLHELSHGWFNHQTIEDRWIREGLAEEYASRVLQATVDQRTAPDAVNLNDPIRLPLVDWLPTPIALTREVQEVQRFHYNASWFVMREISNEIGMESFRDVVSAFLNGESAYPGAETDRAGTWLLFFDLLDRRSPMADPDGLFNQYVIPLQDGFATRRATLDRYDAFFATTDIEPPAGLQRRLANWEFDHANAMLDELAPLVADFGRLLDLESELGLKASDATAELGEATDAADLRRAGQSVQFNLAKMDQLQEYRSRVEALAVEHGIVLDAYVPYSVQGADVAIRNIESRIQDLVQLRTETLDDAARQGVVMVFDQDQNLDDAVTEADDLRTQLDTYLARVTEIGKQAQNIGVELPPVTETRDLMSATEQAEKQMASLEQLARAQKAVDAEGTMHAIGTIGSDIESELDEAQSMLEAGRYAEAARQSNAVETQAALAAEQGRSRLLIAVLLVTATITSTAAVMVTRRQKAASSATHTIGL